MTVQRDGGAGKGDYRRFKIRHQEGQNDFAALQEAVLRHLTRARDEGSPLPDLLLIDGGKGQLSAVDEVVQAAGFAQVPLVSIAKKEELLYRPGNSEPVRLDRRDPPPPTPPPASREAHRF